MKIMNLTENSKLYTSNVFLVLGTWNTIDDINTLIDVGSDEAIINKIESFNTGLGKKKVDQVIITHSHSDHAALLPKIKEAFDSRIYAFNSHLKGVDVVLSDGDILRIGEQLFEVFHITSHSHDSICLYGEQDEIFFIGDTAFPIEFENDVLRTENQQVLSRLQKKKITTVYPGHGSVRYYKDSQFLVCKENNNEM